MGWAVGEHNGRDIGYGVEALCDHPGCGRDIDRGLAYVCGSDVYGGEVGCGLFFCDMHRHMTSRRRKAVELCERCRLQQPPFEPTPDTAQWTLWKLADESWAPWRAVSPDEVAAAEALLAEMMQVYA